MKLLFWKKSNNRKVAKRPRLYRMSRTLMDWGWLAGKFGLSIFIGWGIYHVFVVSDYFKVSNVVVQGQLDHVDNETILKLARVQHEENIFAVNLYSIAQNVKKLPWINHVQVRRQLPSSLVIRVDEHQPFASLAAKNAKGYSYYLMSREGVLFRKNESLDPEHLVISGFEEEDLRNYPAYYSASLRKVYDFLKLFEAKSINNFDLKQIHFDQNIGLTGFLWSIDQERFIQISFGSNPGDRELNLLARMIQTMKNEEVFFSKLDLHVKGRVFARL